MCVCACALPCDPLHNPKNHQSDEAGLFALYPHVPSVCSVASHKLTSSGLRMTNLTKEFSFAGGGENKKTSSCLRRSGKTKKVIPKCLDVKGCLPNIQEMVTVPSLIFQFRSPFCIERSSQFLGL